MKKAGFVISFFLLVASSFCPEKQIKNDLSDLHLKGQIKQITEYIYGFNDSSGIVLPYFQKEIKKFNSAGNLTEENSYLEDKLSSSTKYIYIYDSIKHETTRYKHETPYGLNEILVRKYNQNGDIMEEDNYFGKNIKMLPLRRPDIKLTYYYDDEHNRVKTDDTAVIENIVSYTQFLYKYDSRGNMSESKTIPMYAPMDTIYFKYDLTNNLIEQDAYHWGYDRSITTWKYDKMNSQIEEDGFSINENKHEINTHRYAYDKMGNWVIDTFYRSDNFKCIHKREITY